MNKEMSFGVSTASFIDFEMKKAPLFFKGRIFNRPFTPELTPAVALAGQLGIGLELVYRNGAAEDIIAAIQREKIPVLQVHGPVTYNLTSAFREGLATSGKLRGLILPGTSLLANGTLNSDLEKCLGVAQKLNSPLVVLHPRSAEIFFRKKKKLVGKLPLSAINLAIEPDYKHHQESYFVVWNLSEVKDIVKQINEGACFDISHEIISSIRKGYGTLPNLCEPFDKLNKGCPKGVLSIHLNAAQRNKKGDVDGGLPLDPEISDVNVIASVRNFYRHLKTVGFSGPIIVELSNFMDKGSLEQRKKAVEITLNNLETAPKKPSSLSFSNQPTQKPI